MPDSHQVSNLDQGSAAPGTLGREYKWPHDGTYLQNWNPLLLSEELPAGKIVGKAFLGTKVIVYRDASGKPVVQSAYCPHLGADLSVGGIVNGNVRCPYHFWSFDGKGRCVDIPDEKKIPKGAFISNYPAVEKWGLIWAFNGETPLYDVPELPNIAEEDVVFRARRHGVRPLEGWISTSNSVDFQHLKTVHGLGNVNPTKIEFGDYTVQIRMETEQRIGDTIISGCTWSAFHQRFPKEGTERFFMAGSAQLAPGQSEAYYVVAVRRSEAEKIGKEATEERLRIHTDWVYKLYSEDEPILYSIRFRERGNRILVGLDRHFAAFLKMTEQYPRSAPFDV
jgi:phenylpropionate dioxygenase-like ring-hydroxylating dioxygenase large terminal subunit